MLKISIFCFIVAAIFFIIGICSEVVLVIKDTGIIAIIIVPFLLALVSVFFIGLGLVNYDKYIVNNIKNTINVSYPNAEIISNINNNYNEGYFVYDGKTYHFERDNGVLQVNEVGSMKAITITK